MDQTISTTDGRVVGLGSNSLPGQVASPPQRPASFLGLCPELLFMIVEELQQDERAVDRLGALRLTCRALDRLLTPIIYRRLTVWSDKPEPFDEARHPAEMANVYEYTREILYLSITVNAKACCCPIRQMLDKVKDLRKFKYLPMGRFIPDEDLVYELSRVLLLWEMGTLRQNPEFHIMGNWMDMLARGAGAEFRALVFRGPVVAMLGLIRPCELKRQPREPRPQEAIRRIIHKSQFLSQWVPADRLRLHVFWQGHFPGTIGAPPTPWNIRSRR